MAKGKKTELVIIDRTRWFSPENRPAAPMETMGVLVKLDPDQVEWLRRNADKRRKVLHGLRGRSDASQLLRIILRQLMDADTVRFVDEP